jgi:hypothetical protein
MRKPLHQIVDRAEEIVKENKKLSRTLLKISNELKNWKAEPLVFGLSPLKVLDNINIIVNNQE